MVNTITVTEILQDAAAMIRRNGLSQGARARTADEVEIGVSVKAPAKQLCLEGAVTVAHENARLSGGPMRDNGLHWRSVVEEELARRGLPRDIIEFNDATGRTAEDVAELLTNAARVVTKDAKRKTA